MSLVDPHGQAAAGRPSPVGPVAIGDDARSDDAVARDNDAYGIREVSATAEAPRPCNLADSVMISNKPRAPGLRRTFRPPLAQKR